MPEPRCRADSFNPRPANWPGDAAGSGPPDRSGVSIRARPIGRAMPLPSLSRVRRLRFNPRPANWPGDAASRSTGIWLALVFQSAPGQLAGRCVATERFNPRPANWPGDANARHSWFQSAPGQLAGRCAGRAYVRRIHRSFNPRPANWPGDAGLPATGRWPAGVSIRARPIGRAMPSRAAAVHAPGSMPGKCCFNPRPANWPGDAHTEPLQCEGTNQFQSAPGQLAGRCAVPDRLRTRTHRVSIRARPIGRAMLPRR